MMVSGDLTNESLFAAQKFVRSCLAGNSIDSTARFDLPGGLGLWTKLFSLPISIKGITESDAIIAVGLDSRFYFSVVGVEIRRALKHGAKLLTIDARDSNLARYTDHRLQPAPGREGMLLNAVSQGLSGKKTALKTIAKLGGMDEEAVKKAIDLINAGEDLSVIIGPTVFEYSDTVELLEGILSLAKRKNTNFMPLYHGANVRGAVELGAFGEILPGGIQSKGPGISLADLMTKRRRPKVLYLVGQAPFLERPDCDYLISQDTYYPPFPIDAFLPAASFAEAGGTLTNIEGRVQELVKIENPPEGAVTGYVRPDWQIFSDLSEKLDCQALGYKKAGDILQEIHEAVPGFPAKADREPRRLKAGSELAIEKKDHPPTGKGEFLLVVEPAGFQHRGTDLSYVVEGLGELALEKGVRLNPDDLAQLGVEPGGRITITVDGVKVTATTKADGDCPAKVIYCTRPPNFGGLKECKNLEPLYRLNSNPIHVEVRPA
jgi:formate dehydrogenase major subunit